MTLEHRISIKLKIKAITKRERSRHLHPQCDTRNHAALTCKLFTFAGVNRTCGSFLSPEARYSAPFSVKILITCAFPFMRRAAPGRYEKENPD